MDPLLLGELEHENMLVAMSEAAGTVSGSLVRRTNGVVLLASGLQIRLFNQVLVADGSATANGIAAAVATLRERQNPFVVSLRRGVDDPFIRLMADLGLELPADHGPLPGMALVPIPDGDPPSVEGLAIRPVADAAGLEDHIVAAAAGFGMPEAMLRSIVAVDLWRKPGRTVYVGYVDGEPVTTGLGARTGRTIGVYNISTIESARKRGYGEAMTARVAADGLAAGCDVAILQASDMGRPIYERLGYRTVVEYDWYGEPNTPAAEETSEPTA